jgi:hypothetical protein
LSIVNCHTADSKPVKQEVNSTVILPSLVLPALDIYEYTPLIANDMALNVAGVSTAKVASLFPVQLLTTMIPSGPEL